MGKKRRRQPTSDKIHYIDNEQEIVDWAKRSAAKMSPALRVLFYEATEPKEVIELAKSAGIVEERAMLKVASILAQAAVSGMFVTKEDVSEERFTQFMRGWYIPRMKEVHERSINWFKYQFTMAEPDLVKDLFDKGWTGNAEYIGSAGNIAHYNLYGDGGILLATVDFDPSRKTFQIWFQEW